MYNCEFNKFTSHTVDLIQTELSKKINVSHIRINNRYIVNQTKAESIAISEKEFYSNLYQNKSIERKGGLTRLVLASILNNFPLYYTNTICATNRVFAKEYIISRHIGCLKLLRGEYTEKFVKKIGIVYTLESYYSGDKNILLKFQNYLSDKQKYTKKDLQTFFENHPINYADKESVTHFMLLAVELNKIFKTGKTKILLQYDQIASGLVFISLLWKNIELGEKTNIVLSLNNNVGPYDYALSKIEEFYEINIISKNNKVLEFIKSNKKLHKYALMCYAYNQTTHGRTQDFTDLWVAKFNTKPVSEEWLCLNEISSTKYTQFIDQLFPGINSQFKILDKIRTVDGAVITWKFFKTKRSIRKSFNPHDI